MTVYSMRLCTRAVVRACLHINPAEGAYINRSEAKVDIQLEGDIIAIPIAYTIQYNNIHHLGEEVNFSALQNYSCPNIAT